MNSYYDDDDDGNWHREGDNSSTVHDGVRRKTSIFSLMCEKDPLGPKAAVSFVGTMDECTYFFEVRTLAACAGAEPADQSLGPGGVFGVMWVSPRLLLQRLADHDQSDDCNSSIRGGRLRISAERDEPTRLAPNSELCPLVWYC